MSDLEKSEAALSAARETWRSIAKKTGLAKGRAEQLRKAKAARVLAAAQGDVSAAAALDTANRSLVKATLEAEDLTDALQQAAALVVQAEAHVASLRDAELADQIEAAAGRFAEASVAVDDALAALARALAGREEVAAALVALAPAGSGAELSHRLRNIGAVIRAARHAGLTRWLRLAFAEKHHEAALSAQRLPEVEEVVARLRGGGEREREAA